MDRQRRYMFLIFVCLTSNLIIGGEKVVYSNNQSSLPEFTFTGNHSIENYDYNADGKDDILIFSFEINVIQTGIVMFSGMCIPTVLFWNDSNQLKDDSFHYCLDSNSAIVDLDKTGLTNLSVWYGYGSILSGLKSSDYNYMKNANITLQYYLVRIFSDLSNISTKLSSPTYIVTIPEVQSLSLAITNFGIRNIPFTTNLNRFTTERTVSDIYKWKILQYYEDPPTSDVNFNGTLEIKFNIFTATQVNMSMKTIFSNGSLRDEDFLDIFPDKNLGTTGSSFIQYVIPKNFDVSKLKLVYQVVWNYILMSYNSSPMMTVDQSITMDFDTTDQYFGTHFSFDYLRNDSMGFSNNTISADIIFHLPTGLLSYLELYVLSNSSLIQELRVFLTEPNFGTTFVPDEPTIPDGSSSSDELTTTTTPQSYPSISYTTSSSYSKTITTTDFFSLGPILMIIALSLYMLRKRGIK